jgi:hypothetical protein
MSYRNLSFVFIWKPMRRDAARQAMPVRFKTRTAHSQMLFVTQMMLLFHTIQAPLW